MVSHVMFYPDFSNASFMKMDMNNAGELAPDPLFNLAYEDVKLHSIPSG
jgi:hypothetical protein